MAHRCGNCGWEVSGSDGVYMLDSGESWCTRCAYGNPRLPRDGTIALSVTAGVIGLIVGTILVWRACTRVPTEHEFAIALLNGKVRTVERFLKGGADPDAQYKGITLFTAEDSPLAWYAKSSWSQKGWTALETAAWMGHTEVVEVLLQHGASATNSSAKGMTPLHSAVRAGNTALADLLLAHGADVREQTGQRDEPIHFAAKCLQDVSETTLPWLLSHGADINAKGSYGYTPLHLALAQGKWSTARVLIANGADVDALNDRFCRTEQPLHSAARGRLRPKELELFLEVDGVDVNARDNKGNTALHALAKCTDRPDTNSPAVAEVLLAHGADIDARNECASTPLHLAVGNGRWATAQFLISNGVDVGARDAKGRTPLYNAIYGISSENTQALLRMDGVSVNVKDGEGRTPLHAVAACIDFRLPPSHFEAVLKVFVESGADINARDHQRWTPLHCAAHEKTEIDATHPMVESLLKHGADVNARANDGETPLDVHCLRNYPSSPTADVLRQHGGKTGDELDGKEKPKPTPDSNAATSREFQEWVRANMYKK